MTYTGDGFSLKSGFKKIVLTQELVLALNPLFDKPVVNRPGVAEGAL